MPVYFLGAYISIYVNDIFDEEYIIENKHKCKIICFSIVSLSVILLCFNIANTKDQAGCLYYLFRAISPLAVISCVVLNSVKAKKCRVYSASFFVFCSHSIVVLLLGSVYLK